MTREWEITVRPVTDDDRRELREHATGPLTAFAAWISTWCAECVERAPSPPADLEPEWSWVPSMDRPRIRILVGARSERGSLDCAKVAINAYERRVREGLERMERDRIRREHATRYSYRPEV
jgi:hypothetical protein